MFSERLGLKEHKTCNVGDKHKAEWHENAQNVHKDTTLDRYPGFWLYPEIFFNVQFFARFSLKTLLCCVIVYVCDV